MTTSQTLNKKLLGRALAAEHFAIDALLTELHEAVEARDWREVDARWEAFTARLLDHLDFEEETLLPRFAAAGPQESTEAEALLNEHDRLRQELENLGVDIEVEHGAALPKVADFLVELRAHAKREDALFYPWLDTRAEPTRPEVTP